MNNEEADALREHYTAFWNTTSVGTDVLRLLDALKAAEARATTAEDEWDEARGRINDLEAEVERLREEIEVLDFQLVGVNAGNIALNAAHDRVRALLTEWENGEWDDSPRPRDFRRAIEGGDDD